MSTQLWDEASRGNLVAGIYTWWGQGSRVCAHRFGEWEAGRSQEAGVGGGRWEWDRAQGLESGVLVRSLDLPESIICEVGVVYPPQLTSGVLGCSGGRIHQRVFATCKVKVVLADVGCKPAWFSLQGIKKL